MEDPKPIAKHQPDPTKPRGKCLLENGRACAFPRCSCNVDLVYSTKYKGTDVPKGR